MFRNLLFNNDCINRTIQVTKNGFWKRHVVISLSSAQRQLRIVPFSCPSCSWEYNASQITSRYNTFKFSLATFVICRNDIFNHFDKDFAMSWNSLRWGWHSFNQYQNSNNALIFDQENVPSSVDTEKALKMIDPGRRQFLNCSIMYNWLPWIYTWRYSSTLLSIWGNRAVSKKSFRNSAKLLSFSD